jgi:hypothetical protein
VAVGTNRSSGATTWSGRLADIEPDFDAFAARFTKWKARDPDADGYGQSFNPPGRWDWWELWGRFDGAISGHPRPGAGNDSMISSGPTRAATSSAASRASLAASPPTSRPRSKPTSRSSPLLEAARRGEDRAFPTAVVLPEGACADEFRWIDALGWCPIPPQTKVILTVPDDAPITDIAPAAYKRFHTMAAAGMAFHF